MNAQAVAEVAERVAEWYRLRDQELVDAGLRSLANVVAEKQAADGRRREAKARRRREAKARRQRERRSAQRAA